MAGLPVLLGKLFQDALALARAEVALAKSRIVERLRRSLTGIVLLVVAFLIVQGAFAGLFVGFVLALLPLVGAAGAGAIIFVAALAVAGLLGFFASRQFAPPPSEPSSAEIQP